MAVLTPLQESYSPDDNREPLLIMTCVDHTEARLSTGFDLRPFLYPARFDHQFHKIDILAEQLPNRATQPGSDKAKVD